MTRKLILKFLSYLYSITTDPLKMTRHRGRAEVSACLLLFILVLDLHRYGAWYSGNRCFLRPYAVPVLIIIAMPFIIYAMAVMIRWFIKTERFNLLVFIISTLGLYMLFFPFMLPFLLPDKNDWLHTGFFRDFDWQFLKTLLVTFVIIICIEIDVIPEIFRKK